MLYCDTIVKGWYWTERLGYHHGGARFKQQLHTCQRAGQRRQVQRRHTSLSPGVDVPVMRLQQITRKCGRRLAVE